MKQKHIDMCSHINLSTKPEDILQTMLLELPVVKYFYHKDYGGRNRYNVFEDSQLDLALAEKHDITTNVSEYISQKGNRWISYLHIEYFPKAQYAKAWPTSFIYYETYASCGAFFPMYRPAKKQNKKKDSSNDEMFGVIIYTDHFFLRMADRTGKAYRSRELIREFITTMQTHAAQADEDGDIIVKFRGGYGFGKKRADTPCVLEVRTYLTDKQLSPSQRRKCERVDAAAEMLADGMFLKEVAAHTAYHSALTPSEAAANGLRKLKAAKKLGLENLMVLMSAIHLAFVRIIQDLLHIEVSMQQSAVIADVTGENDMSFAKKWAYIDGDKMTAEQEAEFREDFIDTMVMNARQLKLRSINRDAVAQLIDDIMADSLRRAEEFGEEA